MHPFSVQASIDQAFSRQPTTARLPACTEVPTTCASLCRAKEHVQGRLTAHTQEVCGLKWSPSGTQLASGGNDNLLHIWQAGATQPLHRLASHNAAVKVNTTLSRWISNYFLDLLSGSGFPLHRHALHNAADKVTLGRTAELCCHGSADEPSCTHCHDHDHTGCLHGPLACVCRHSQSHVLKCCRLRLGTCF